MAERSYIHWACPAFPLSVFNLDKRVYHSPNKADYEKLHSTETSRWQFVRIVENLFFFFFFFLSSLVCFLQNEYSRFKKSDKHLLCKCDFTVDFTQHCVQIVKLKPRVKCTIKPSRAWDSQSNYVRTCFLKPWRGRVGEWKTLRATRLPVDCKENIIFEFWTEEEREKGKSWSLRPCIIF